MAKKSKSSGKKAGKLKETTGRRGRAEKPTPKGSDSPASSTRARPVSTDIRRAYRESLLGKYLRGE